MLEVSEETKKAGERSIYQSLKYNVSKSLTSFEFFSKPNKNLIITPVIKNNEEMFKNLLFFPKFKEIQINQDCQVDVNALTCAFRQSSW